MVNGEWVGIYKLIFLWFAISPLRNFAIVLSFFIKDGFFHRFKRGYRHDGRVVIGLFFHFSLFIFHS